MDRTDKINLLLAKLRNPLPLDYIAQNILHTDKSEVISLLNELIEINVIIKVNDTYEVKRYGK